MEVQTRICSKSVVRGRLEVYSNTYRAVASIGSDRRFAIGAIGEEIVTLRGFNAFDHYFLLDDMLQIHKRWR